MVAVDAKTGEGGRAAYLRRRRDATRAAILLAGRQVFARATYIEARIDDIIRAAGVSRATFYAHFATKLDLAYAIYDEIAPQTTALFARLPGLVDGDALAMRGWLLEFVGLYVGHRYVTPLIAQLQLFEDSFRQRMAADGDALIDLVGRAGVPSFARAMGKSEDAARQRIRARLLFNRVAYVCAQVARGEIASEQADTWLAVVGEEMIAFLREPDAA
jgi:AcrR family transcriptional regulator